MEMVAVGLIWQKPAGHPFSGTALGRHKLYTCSAFTACMAPSPFFPQKATFTATKRVLPLHGRQGEGSSVDVDKESQAINAPYWGVIALGWEDSVSKIDVKLETKHEYPKAKWRREVTIFRLGLSILTIMAALGAEMTVQAQDAEVVGRLTRHSGMSKAAAKTLVNKVSARMRQAADPFANPNDPVRAAMRAAMFGHGAAGAQPNPMNEAKVRLQLYGGLTAGTLTALFMPSPGTLQGCRHSLGLSAAQCEALMAAAAQTSVSQARAASRGPAPVIAPPPAPAPATTYGAPVARPVPPRATGASVQPMAAVRPVRQARPQPRVSTAEAYRARRARYLAKFKKQAEAKKKARQKAAASAPQPPVKPVAAPEPVAATPAAAPAAAPAARPTGSEPVAKAPAAAPAAAEPKPAAPPKPKPKQDPEMESFLSDLLADPLGKKK